MRVRGLGRARHLGQKAAREMRRIRGGVIVLCYHRVATLSLDPWVLALSPDRFAEHLEALRSWGPILPLAELSSRLQMGRLPRRATAITFDDGYTDNLVLAKPLLEQADAPATMFLTTGDGGRTREFWWDELEQVLLQPGVLPPRLRLTVGSEVVEWDLADDAVYDRQAWRGNKDWRAYEPPPSRRHALFLLLYKRLLALPPQAQREALDGMLAWADVAPHVRPSHRTVAEDEIRVLADSQLVDIGAHTVTHPALPVLSRDQQQTEWAASRRALETILDRPVRSGAYPYGRHSAESMQAAREAGLDYAFATDARPVARGDSPWALPRLGVGNWDGDALLRHFVDVL